jgi:hypothetical protein
MHLRTLILIGAILGLMACSWVKLTPEGEKVRVLAAFEVTTCKKLGKTIASVTNKVIGFERKDDAVQANLEVLARNAAADMKGDTIVAASPIENGKQTFDVYRCVGP